MSARTLIRIAIVALAALALLYFFDDPQFAYAIIAREGVRLSAVLSALAPFSALAAAGLALFNSRLVLAGLLLVATPLLYFAPILPFALAVAIHGI